MKENYILTENMTVGYDGIPLIRQVRIHVRPGEIVTLIGPDRVGKLIILRSIIRQLGLLEGAVYLDGTPTQQVGEREIAGRISVLMTERIHPEFMTREDMVSTGRYSYTGRMGILTTEDKKKVKEVMGLVHAWDLIRRGFSETSDGQKQRILLARAVCQEPRATVSDEPTSFPDIRHKLELPAIPKGLVHKKMVVALMSLHKLDLAQKLSDYIVCINKEYIERCGTPGETFTSSYITNLYGTMKGSYHTELDYLRMEPVRGTPRVLVIGGNGSGVPVYRKLQRMGIPSATGILRKSDMDYLIAVALTAKVISEAPFELIREEAYEWATAIMESCGQVIYCLKDFGAVNEKSRKLTELGRDRPEPRRFS